MRVRASGVMRSWLAGCVVALLTATPCVAANDSDQERERAVDALFDAMDRPDVPGAAVGIYREGRVVYSHGYGSAQLGRDAAVTPHTVFHVASVSKQFTAFAIALLAREGKLDLDRKISTYLRDLPEFGDVVTVRDLVLHVNGLQEVNIMFWLAQRSRADNPSQQQALNLIRRQRELGFEPGTRFNYNNSGYTLLAEIVQSVSGQTLRQFTSARVFQPLGMRQTFFRDDAREIVPEFAEAYESNAGGWRRMIVNSELLGASGLYTTVDDLLKWLGNFDQPRVGDPALIGQISTPGKLRDGKPLNYAFGLYRQSYAGHDAIAHDGSDYAYRSTIVYLPRERFGVVVLANSQRNLGTIARQIVEIYLGAGAASRSVVDGGAAPIKPRRPLVQAMLGHYLQPNMWAADLVEKDGEVWWQSMSWGNSKLTFREGDVFSRSLGTETRYFRIERNSSKEVVGFRALDVLGASSGDLFERIAPVAPSLAELQALEGDYRTAQLDITYTFKVVDGTLTARSLWSVAPMSFQPVAPDRYDASDIAMGSIRFTRDASGRPAGFRIVGGGMRGTVFERLP